MAIRVPVEFDADAASLGKDLKKSTDSATADVGRSLNSRLGKAGQQAGRSLADGYYRDANGRLRAANGRFASATEAAMVEAAERGNRGFLSRFNLDGIANKARSAVGKVGGLLATGLKRGAQAAGVGLTAVIGTALVKGFGRLNAIDQAEAKLRGLGYTAQEITGITTSALNAVKGTAFGLDEAASAAATALASGVQPGKELEKYLTLIGDAATQGGSSFNEMASVINKTTARGKVGMENLNQLSERGIGIMGWLADEYGVSGAELSKMVSRGEVDLKTFQKVLNDNIGGAAQESGKTFQGALANTGAALGRLGATVLGPIFQRLPGILTDITTGLDTLGPYADRVAKVLGGAFASALDSINFAAIGNGIKEIAGALSGLFQSGQDSGTFDRIAKSLGGFASSTGALISDLVAAFKELWPTIQQVGGQILGALLPALESIWGSVSGRLIPSIRGLIKAVVPVYKFFLKAFGPAIAGMLKGLGKVITGVVDVIAGAIDLVVGILTGDWAKAWDGLSGIVTGALRIIGGLIKTFFSSTVLAVIKTGFGLVWGAFRTGMGAIGGIIRGALSGVAAIFGTIWGAVSAVVSGALNGIVAVVRGGLSIVSSVVVAVLGVVRTIFTRAFNGYRAIVSSVLGAIRGAVSAGMDAVKRLFSTAVNGISRVWSTVWNGLKGTATKAWGGVQRWLGTIASKVTSALAGLGSAISAPFRSAFGAVARLWNSTVGKIKFEVPSWVPGVGGKGWGFPTIPGYADGTLFAPGGMALVGERGPELVNLPRGSQVKTAAKTRNVLQDAAARTVTVTQNYYGPTTSGGRLRELDWTLRYATKARTGVAEGLAS